MHPYTASPGASGLSSIYMHGSLHSKPLTPNPKTRNKILWLKSSICLIGLVIWVVVDFSDDEGADEQE